MKIRLHIHRWGKWERIEPDARPIIIGIGSGRVVQMQERVCKGCNKREREAY